MTQKSEQQRVPQWLTMDLLVICVPLVMIGLAALVAI
jgi:hypothetical protein